MAKYFKKNDVRLSGSDICGDWRVIFKRNLNDNADTATSVTLDPKLYEKSANIRVWDAKHTVTFRGVSTSVMFEEKFQPIADIGSAPKTQTAISARVLLQGSQLDVVGYHVRKYSNTTGTGVDITWSITGDINVEHAHGTMEYRHLNATHLEMVRYQARVENSRFVTLRIRDFSQMVYLPDIQPILDILSGIFQRQPTPPASEPPEISGDVGEATLVSNTVADDSMTREDSDANDRMQGVERTDVSSNSSTAQKDTQEVEEFFRECENIIAATKRATEEEAEDARRAAVRNMINVFGPDWRQDLPRYLKDEE